MNSISSLENGSGIVRENSDFYVSNANLADKFEGNQVNNQTIGGERGAGGKQERTQQQLSKFKILPNNRRVVFEKKQNAFLKNRINEKEEG